jgi:glycerophosphoryl diester phosphodiesterase
MNILTSLTARPVIAHRGNAAHAPENTIEAFAQALSLGADAIEFDVHASRDGVPVVLHDPTLQRTAGRADPVASLTLAQLREANAGMMFSKDGGLTFPYRDRGLRIPTVAELLTSFPDALLLIEVKVPEAAEPLARVLEDAGAFGRSVIGSMLFDAVVPFRKRGLPTVASSGEVSQLLVPALLHRRIPGRLPYDALSIPRWYNGFPVPVATVARAARRVGVVTHVWTVDSTRIAKRLWRAGVQGIVTNDPAAIIEARGELEPSRD